MKVYEANGKFFERQADARAEDRAFNTLDLPFGASPKGEFIQWLNDNFGQLKVEREQARLDDKYGESDALDAYVEREAERAASRPAHEPRPCSNAEQAVDYILDEATTNAQIEQAFAALGARFHEAIRRK